MMCTRWAAYVQEEIKGGPGLLEVSVAYIGTPHLPFQYISTQCLLFRESLQMSDIGVHCGQHFEIVHAPSHFTVTRLVISQVKPLFTSQVMSLVTSQVMPLVIMTSQVIQHATVTSQVRLIRAAA